MKSVKLVGLGTCDTCRKARKGLADGGLAVTFQDVRADPPTRAALTEWLTAFGADLVNRRSTTWRGLTEADRALPAPDLLLAHPTLMKRPVVIADGVLMLGWSEVTRKVLLGA